MLTRDDVKNLHNKLQPILDKISAEVGYKLIVGKAIFSETITFKLECSKLEKDGTAQTKQELDFKFYAASFGLKPEDLGRTFVYDSNIYKIVGLNPRATRNPIIASFRDRNFVFNHELVKLCLENKDPKREKEIRSELESIEIQLSPENLSQDGELPKWKVDLVRSQLNNKKRKLLKELACIRSERKLV